MKFRAVLTRQGACVVGILDDDDLMEIAQLVEEANKFKPQELNEANVQAIFNRCLATEGEGNLTYAQVLMPELSGKQSDLIRFSKERIKANSKNISYLYGQLKGVHLQARLILLEFGIINCRDEKWTASADILLMLYELGMVNLNMTPFSLQEDKSLATDISMNKYPTLSPKDPAFPAWWEAHKGEWEEPK